MLHEIRESSTAQSVDSSNNSALIGQFLKYFFHPWHFIQKQAGDNSWSTESRYPIAAANLWHYWSEQNTIVGIRFGQQTRYALIDIDRESLYHPANDPAALPRIRQALESIGIYRTVLVRSSESKGLHLYSFFSEALPTFEVGRAIAYALTSATLTIAPGTLEVFPNAKRYRPDQPSNYNGHRLPLQKGSFLLNRDCEPVTNDISYFLEVADLTARGNDITEIINSFEIAKEHARKSNFTKTGEPKGLRGRLWKADCERVIELGWTGNGQTNQLLGVIAQYGRVFKGLADQALEQFVLQTAIACPGYSEYCRHQHEIEQRCRDWAHSAQKAYTPYVGDRVGSMWSEQKERKANRHNDDQAATALERIKNAIAQLGDRVFTSIREKVSKLASAAKCSITTLYKHRSLWEGCNSQNEPTEGILDADQKVLEKDLESLEPLQNRLLHPNCDYEGVGRDPISSETENLSNSAPESEFFPKRIARRAAPSDRNVQKPP